MSKKLEDRPAFMKSVGNEYRASLAKIQPVLVPESVEHALSAKVLEQVNIWLSAGKGTSEVIRLLGLSYDDPRWQAIRRQILKQTLPENEMEALLRSYQDQEQLLDKMNDLLREVDSKIEEVPRTEEEKRAYHNYYKYKLDILKEMMTHRSDRFRQYMEMKKLSKGSGDTNIQILIQNNIPRPEKMEKIVKEVKKLGS